MRRRVGSSRLPQPLLLIFFDLPAFRRVFGEPGRSAPSWRPHYSTSRACLSQRAAEKAHEYKTGACLFERRIVHRVRANGAVELVSAEVGSAEDGAVQEFARGGSHDPESSAAQYH